jgi:hypothetical protein
LRIADLLIADCGLLIAIADCGLLIAELCSAGRPAGTGEPPDGTDFFVAQALA